MNKTFRSSFLKLVINCLLISLMLVGTIFVLTLELDFHLGSTIGILIGLISFFVFLTLFSITVEITTDEIIFSRITGVYKTISMFEPDLYFEAKKNDVGLVKTTNYFLNVTTQTETKKIQLPYFTKKAFNALNTEFKVIREAIPFEKFIRHEDKQFDSTTDDNQQVQVFHINKEATLKAIKKKIRGHAIPFIIYTVICSLILFRLIDSQIILPTEKSFVVYLFFFWVIAAISTTFNLIKLYMHRSKIQKWMPTQIIVYPGYIKFDDMLFAISKMNSLKLPELNIKTLLKGYSLKFTYEGIRYHYFLETGPLLNTPAFPDVYQLCNALASLYSPKD